MKRLFITTLFVSAAVLAHAQQSTITGLRAVGLLPQYNELGQPSVGVVAQIDLTYSQIAADDAGCVVLMHNGRLPQVNTAVDLLEAAQKYCRASEDLTASAGQKSERMELFLPLDNRLNGTDKMLYL